MDQVDPNSCFDSRRRANRNTGTQGWLGRNMVHVNNDETTPSPAPRLQKMGLHDRDTNKRGSGCSIRHGNLTTPAADGYKVLFHAKHQ